MTYDEGWAWIYSHIEVKSTKLQILQQTSDRNCACSCFYHLPNEDGEKQFVCLTFVLHTLGYKSAKIINYMSSSCNAESITCPVDKRGKHAPAHKFPDAADELIRDHIISHHPAVSHYRREYATEEGTYPRADQSGNV